MVRYDKNQLHYVAATVILARDGKFLIAKRADWEKAFPSKWTVPGGKLEVLDYMLREKDTSVHWYNVLEELARREVQEEVGLRVGAVDYVTSLVYVRPDGIPSLIVSLWSDDFSGDVVLCDALSDYAWVTLEQAKEYDLIEGIYEELVILDERLRTSVKKNWENIDVSLESL